MSNLTVSLDDDLIKRARIRAIQQGTSLSAKVREFLSQYANESDEQVRLQRQQAAAKLMTTIELATARTQPAAPRATRKRRTLREELYDGDFRARDRRAGKRGDTG